MAFQIEFEQQGAVTYFTGEVSGSDLLRAEREIALRAKRQPLRFAISVFLNTEQVSFADLEYQLLNTIRYRGYAAKPGIKFAMVTRCESMKTRFLLNHEDKGFWNEAAVFSSFVDAVDWARS
jgi:hypothetical protein